MSSKNTFTIMYQRENKVKKLLYDFFMLISSYPRLLIEVFTRKQFGQRYFSQTSVVILALIMLYLPFFFTGNFDFVHPKRNYGEGSFMGSYATWFIYTGAFFILSYLHLTEIEKHGSVFEGKRFSLSTGNLHPIFHKIKIFESERMKEIIVEPAVFFILGFILWKFDQNIGMVLMICSVIYSLSYVAAYNGGDNFIMDKLDQMIFNEELEKVFMHDTEPEKARGVKMFSDKPTAQDLRQKIYEVVSENEETAVAI